MVNNDFYEILKLQYLELCIIHQNPIIIVLGLCEIYFTYCSTSFRIKKRKTKGKHNELVILACVYKFRKDFVDYADVCFREFGDRVKSWNTFNEPMIFCAGGYGSGTKAPGRCSPYVSKKCAPGDSGNEPYVAGHNLLLAHAEAVRLYRQKYQVDIIHLNSEHGSVHGESATSNPSIHGDAGDAEGADRHHAGVALVRALQRRRRRQARRQAQPRLHVRMVCSSTSRNVH